MRRFQFFPPASVRGFLPLSPGGWTRWGGWPSPPPYFLYYLCQNYLAPKIPGGIF